MRTLISFAATAAIAAFALSAQAQYTPAPATPAAADAGQPAAGGKLDAATLKTAFKRADANGDGKLSREEAATLPAVAEKFTQIDKDGDGVLSATEFEAGASVLAQPAK